MTKSLKQHLERLVPFIILGVAISLFIGLFIMLSYVLIWGIAIGGIIWLAMLLKNYLFPPHAPEQNEGRVIEHDDKK
jgi:hypothetical protein